MSDIKPRAAIFVARGEKVLYKLNPGGGFPKDANGNQVSQGQFEEILGTMVEHGISLIGISGWHNQFEPEKGDRIVVLTNEAQMAAQRQEQRCRQVAEDFVFSLKELVDDGLVVFPES